ncbi:metabotropic glutamate receptor 5-like isoform X2 [Sitophilus oryzae]|uniref:Metabotropic glutamate receptor 5-like isoform X2 n=1 Tax=Sitophilus oryzae TaxID=7048 RepID=A0A6J2XRI3_SITOR|nr:metabotropic glutamate receptor 5-like isoform X2 [Sitophilus oryzae]
MQNVSLYWILVAIFFLAFVYVGCSDNVQTDVCTSAFINGDFIIGALFPLHHQPSSKTRHLGLKCGEIREQYGIQRVEVALQTLDTINNDSSLLPNLTLGMEIRDECWYAPVALRESMKLIRDSLSISSNMNICYDNSVNQHRGPLIGVVGPGSSSVALQVQNLLQLFHVPQIGYSSTSKDLSDKSRFNYFLRVVPSDYYQAQAILDIVSYFGWNYVSAVNTNENYGQSGIQAFQELAENASVCIARTASVLSGAADADFDKIILDLRRDPNATVVVCFCEGLTVKGLLAATRRLNMTNHFLFIGSDGWADRMDVTKEYEQEALGGMSIRIHSPHVDSFDNYYFSLKPETNRRNPWFEEFWEEKFHCILKDKKDTSLHISKNTQRTCTGQESLKQKDYKQDPKLSFVRKAIYSFAYALHNMHNDICGKGLGVCKDILPFNGSLFRNYLMKVSFESNNELFRFDENGDPPGRYDIMNFRKVNGTYDYVQIGTWNNRSLVWARNFNHPQLKGKNVTSICSEECSLGSYKSEKQLGNKKCCWVCVPCLNGEILTKNKTSCQKCPAGFSPNENKTSCVQLPIVFVRWFDGSAITAMTIAVLGLLSTTFTLMIFLKYNDTPVVKASTKELSYIILIGTALAYMSIFAMLGEPSKLSCTITRFLPGLSFGMIYSALLTKTNRIARILVSSKKKFPNRKLLWMSAASQVIITLSMVFVEAVIAGSMLYYQVPETTEVYQPQFTLLECKITTEGVIVPYLFDFFLILLCTVYAVMTRNVPENFNEAKFIGFAMYTTCVIWIAFTPIYYGSGAKVITMSMCVTLSALVNWTFLFVPRLYIIILKPEKNNRAFFTTTKIRCHIGPRVSAALSEKGSMHSWAESSISVNINNTA